MRIETENPNVRIYREGRELLHAEFIGRGMSTECIQEKLKEYDESILFGVQRLRSQRADGE